MHVWGVTVPSDGWAACVFSLVDLVLASLASSAINPVNAVLLLLIGKVAQTTKIN